MVVIKYSAVQLTMLLCTAMMIICDDEQPEQNGEMGTAEKRLCEIPPIDFPSTPTKVFRPWTV